MIGRSAGRGDDGIEIFVLAVDRVRWVISAVSATPAVVVEHGELRGEQAGKGCVHVAVGRPCVDEDHGRPAPGAIERDAGAVLRNHGCH